MKRAFDVLVSLLVMVLGSPIILLVAVLVRIYLGKPVLFRQQRPGRNEKPFVLLKFRSMLDATDADLTPLPDDQRLTRFGIFLRKSSLDELPSLWNVFVGEMSLVGPRPLLMQYLPLYSQSQKRRHEVRPGLTGWAQVNGRNNVGWQNKFRFDLEYVDNASMLFDCKILWLTVLKVLTADGVSKDGHATTEPFTGNEKPSSAQNS